ncbi:RhtB family transporter [Streptococcus sanguinis]|uniref:RhtB family transporter n=1 Tax=Streptococcus sanguinis TaxID=1305 RepID=A0A5A7ZH29_STRSA|nr:RhtB family transporter [Streptococcus sanguinis]KAA0116512.1 RhtB family transporter [Streptococcus sanguinis]
MVAFVSYTHVYLVFVASVLPGIDDFLPVFAEKFLQRKARALFAASYLFAGAFYSSGELASIETMRS